MSTKSRKSAHIRIAISENVQFRKKTTGLEKISFENIDLQYKALPELDKKEISLNTEFLGKKFKAPLMVEAITGGVEEAKKINRDIAKACEQLGIGMGLGSQRAMIEKPALKDTYTVRGVAPTIFLAGNIGITELGKYNAKEIERALLAVGADALAVHINAAQAAMQPEKETNFKNRLKELEKIVKQLKKPVYVKEVGHGIGLETAKALARTGIKAIDVAGAGGTSWIAVDSFRGNKGMGETFWDFGIPTAESIIQCRKAFKGKIIASGGIRSGLDCAKAIGLGADICGIALPVLKAQQAGGSAAVEKYLKKIIEELRTAMFLAGAKNLQQLKGKT
ncbi:MAG: type 2 isopentenyl-diphosphate Delta-isomerase, partial [Candidatus Diapherotrites archaeon]|nr:type 2 isopentenyl-diphosphate Delta-isomerase [Candidatus Diapherotrites archaeon]